MFLILCAQEHFKKKKKTSAVAHYCFVKTSVLWPKCMAVQDYDQTAVLLLLILLFLAERSREWVVLLRLIWSSIFKDYGRSLLPVSVSLSVTTCNPGKSSRSHRWATSDPEWSSYAGIISHLRACMRWVIVTVNQSANIDTETTDWAVYTY